MDGYPNLLTKADLSYNNLVHRSIPTDFPRQVGWVNEVQLNIDKCQC
jgi:sporulation protein YlmC with PRC-barrel domain